MCLNLRAKISSKRFLSNLQVHLKKYSHPSLISYRLSMSLQLDKWMPHVVPSCTLKWHRIKNIGDQSHMQHQHSSLISKTTSRLIEKLNFCFSGNATEVLFHVTVMSLDTIDESSMVRISNQSQSIVRKLEKKLLSPISYLSK